MPKSSNKQRQGGGSAALMSSDSDRVKGTVERILGYNPLDKSPESIALRNGRVMAARVEIGGLGVDTLTEWRQNAIQRRPALQADITRVRKQLNTVASRGAASLSLERKLADNIAALYRNQDRITALTGLINESR